MATRSCIVCDQERVSLFYRHQDGMVRWYCRTHFPEEARALMDPERKDPMVLKSDQEWRLYRSRQMVWYASIFHGAVGFTLGVLMMLVVQWLE